jgi:hypothetical protein
MTVAAGQAGPRLPPSLREMMAAYQPEGPDQIVATR